MSFFILMEENMKKTIITLLTGLLLTLAGCSTAKKQVKTDNTKLPESINIEGIALNPEGIEFDKNDNTFLLSSLNAMPVVKVNPDGTYKPFTSGEKFPLSTAGLHIDYKRNRLLVAGFNGMELMDKNPETKGTAHLRIYNLKTGALENDINLSHLAPEANAYFANDITVDNDGNVYVSDWYAKLIYKVDLNGKASVFWNNKTEIKGGPNGLDFHPDGYLLVSLLNVNDKGLYSDYGLIKIPVNAPETAEIVNIDGSEFTGFDGMVITSNGNIIGVTNNQKTPGGNKLIELSGKDNWKSAEVVNSKSITPSTTVAVSADNKYYVINQDFSDNNKKEWKIEEIKF